MSTSPNPPLHTHHDGLMGTGPQLDQDVTVARAEAQWCQWLLELAQRLSPNPPTCPAAPF
eukprot:CAMPEP_0181325734 /NCGR_PEP_ID=MMETSP1101-20121128/21098_1 /TAXON_ID=46948 /ORGANISM="Rhodomonas abbreviata, Strain Caron Lab Isolate" /LENGTH=59 /DNA_ID=CAMNT_0023434091 /DNA_START=217 /DNA_END=393 /DNA_ORIENTATION=-